MSTPSIPTPNPPSARHWTPALIPPVIPGVPAGQPPDDNALAAGRAALEAAYPAANGPGCGYESYNPARLVLKASQLPQYLEGDDPAAEVARYVAGLPDDRVLPAAAGLRDYVEERHGFFPPG